MPARTSRAGRSSAARADFGASIDGFLRKQPPPLRAILHELRRLIETATPEVRSSLKWGMPCFTVAGHMMCMLGGHQAHVNLVLVGPNGTFADPQGLLAGDGKGGRHLKLRSLDEIPRTQVVRWIRAATAYARSKAKAG
jgi:hypothetical protein